MAKRKNVMKEFSINEISGVDVPAQVGASATIMKRATAINKQDKETKMLTEEEKRKAALAKAKKAKQDAEDEMDGGDDEAAEGDAKKTKKALKDAVTKAEKLEADLAIAKAIGEMTDAEKTHYKGLSEAEQTEWLAKSADERKEVLADIAKGNPVVYKAADGTEFRKNDDPRLVAFAKRADKADKDAAEALAKNQNAEFAKRAEVEMKNLKGDSAAKVAVIKALEGIADEALRGQAKEILKAANEIAGMAFENKGHNFTKVDENSPAGQLEALAKNHAELHKVSFAKAYDEVLKTAEGKKLYDQTQKK